MLEILGVLRAFEVKLSKATSKTPRSQRISQSCFHALGCASGGEPFRLRVVVIAPPEGRRIIRKDLS
jgi:hypothetical protein